MSSSFEAEQLLGRVLHMPYAKRRQIEGLNHAYAHLSSSKFGKTVQEMEEKLITMGVESLEMTEMLRTPKQHYFESDEADFPLFQKLPTMVFSLSKMPDLTTLNDDEKSQVKRTQENGTFVLQITGNISENLEKTLTKTTTGQAKEKIINQIKFHNAKATQLASSAKKSEQFKAIAQLCVNIQGELTLADPDELLAHYGWNLLDYSANLENLNLETDSPTFEIDVENNRLARRLGKYQLSFSNEWLELSENDLVHWLAKQVGVPDMKQKITLKFLHQIISNLLAKPNTTLTQLIKNNLC